MAVGRWWRRYRGWVAVAALVAIGLTAYLVLRGGEPETAATTYTTTAAERGTISVTVAGSGNLDVRDLVSVTPKVSGTIASLAVEEGDRVEAGDVLFVLDDEDADKATAQALAAQRQAQQSVHQAEVSVLQAGDSLDKLEDRSDDATNAPTDDELAIAREAGHDSQGGPDLGEGDADARQDGLRERQGRRAGPDRDRAVRRRGLDAGRRTGRQRERGRRQQHHAGLEHVGRHFLGPAHDRPRRRAGRPAGRQRGRPARRSRSARGPSSRSTRCRTSRVTGKVDEIATEGTVESRAS